MKKMVAVMLAGVLALALLAGCGGSGAGNAGGGTTGGGTGTDEVKTLQVVWFSDGGEGASFQRLADQYSEENPNIRIELIDVPFNELENRLRNMINGQNPPAIARLVNVGSFTNQLVDLFEYSSQGEAFADNFGEGLQFVYDGKMLAAPMDVTANGLIYNKTAFDQAGVSVPLTEDEIWTWDEWKQAMQDVVAGSDCTFGMVYDRSPHRLSTLMYQAGASLLNEDLTASNFNTPEMERAVTFFKELHDEQIIPASVWLGSENPNNLFRTGQIAMHFAGSWMIGNYKEEITDFDWGVCLLPEEAMRATTPGGKLLGAFQGSGVEQEAADFIEWLSQPEINAQFCTENYFLSQVVGNEQMEYDFGAEFFEIFSKDLAATNATPGREWGFQTFTAMVQNDIRDEMASVLAGQMTVEQYLTDMDGKINDALADINQ